MRVQDEIEIPAPAAVRATGLAHAVQTAPVARPPLDVVTIMGVLEADLTPKARVALEKLLTEGQTLRRNLERARRRIEFLEQLADRLAFRVHGVLFARVHPEWSRNKHLVGHVFVLSSCCRVTDLS